jgi:hypothetical protein
MPADDGGRADDQQGVLPAGPASRQPDPEQPVARPEAGPSNRPPQNRQLLSEGQVFGRQRAPAYKEDAQPEAEEEDWTHVCHCRRGLPYRPQVQLAA